ncbi:MAG TPA: hypothetical protein DCP90_06720 [Clostridiales bacterium]|nr:hypothetical protein [Clostridiales bacterium]
MIYHVQTIILIFLLLTFITTSYAQSIYYMVSGNSMYPTYKDGDIVKVEKKESYNDGDTVVADVGGKKVVKRINGDILEGDNKSNTARYDLKMADILGKVEYNTDKLTDEEKKEFEKVFASGVEMVSAGAGHTVALKSDGTVWTWGSNNYGQLGVATNSGTPNPNTTPTQVIGLAGTTQISAGGSHTIALKSDGTVWTWGRNYNGQLGIEINNGTTDPNPTPTQVTGLTGVAKVSAGENHTVVLMSDGTVKTWGSNQYGQLGNATNSGTSTANVTPLVVADLTEVTQISAGGNHTVVYKSNGEVWTWGRNIYGQLGNSTNNGTNNPNSTPTQVAGLTGVAQISAGGSHTVALKGNGTVWTWGRNLFGELGIETNSGTNNPNPTPAQAAVLAGISHISAGGSHTVALKSDGTVWTCGWNSCGQLGKATNSGTNNPNPTPTQVTGLTGVSQVSAGQQHTVIQKNDKTVYGWGRNYFGEIGTTTNNGTNNPNITPASVLDNIGQPFTLIDTTPPTAVISYSPSAPYKSGTAVTITATFDEPVADSPVPQISISGANTQANTNMTKTSSTVYTYTHTVGVGDGTATVAMATAQDLVGNVVIAAPTSGATFTVDNTPPAVPTFTPSTADWTNQDITVEIDYPAGSITPQYQIDLTGWQAYTGELTIPSNCAIHARCYDEANNVSTTATLNVIKIDKTPPNAPTASPATGTYNVAQTVTVSNTSGDVAHTYYTTDGTDPDNTDTEVIGGTLSIDGVDGQTITLKLVSYDGINKGAISIPYLYTFNKTGPIITANPTGRTKSPDNINVNITITSDNLNNWQYQWDTDTTLDEDDWTTGTTNPQDLDPKTEDGTWYLHVRAEDDDENIITQTYGTYKKGTVSPIEGYAADSYPDERKYFKYYVGLDANNIGRVMLAAPKDVGGVKQIFTRNDILDPETNRFKVGGVYYIDREGKIQEYN